ncbi:flagellar basal body-associated FliL family protein [Marinitoga arctica]
MPDEEVKEEIQEGKKGPNILLLLLIAIVVSVILSLGGAFFLINILGKNIVQQAQEQAQQQAQGVQQRVQIGLAEVIREGHQRQFMLKGGNEIAIVNALQLKVGSDESREAIAQYNVEILEAVGLIFITKTREDLTTVEGREILKNQIKNAINEITGFVGEKEKFGVIQVIIDIVVITSAY